MSQTLASISAKNKNSFFKGQHAIVVGGSSGIGAGIAVRLAKAQFDVTIIGRNESRGAEVVNEMKLQNSDGVYSFVSLDCHLLSNIFGLSSKFPRVDRLVLSQGVGTLQGRTETPEGIDQKLALHYYGRMAFIEEFAGKLRESSGPRVLSVLSAGIHSPYKDYKTDPELKSHYSLRNAADIAGFYTDLALEHLAEDPLNKDKIVFAHSSPGVVDTNWGHGMPLLVRGLLYPLKKIAGKSRDDCGEFMCDFLLDKDVTPGELKLINQYGGPAKVCAVSDREEAKSFVWKHTLEVFERVRSTLSN
ncbi:hypothetical protein HK096_004745 [Nowakowskiella sp. JEL0078]|nr:hypothetical protein HK096_004745 [Nowakowskiella sp. JEL0078]